MGIIGYYLRGKQATILGCHWRPSREEADHEYRFQWCRAPRVTRIAADTVEKLTGLPKGPPVDSLSMFESHTPVVCTRGPKAKPLERRPGNGGASWRVLNRGVYANPDAHARERERDRERGLCESDPPLCK